MEPRREPGDDPCRGRSGDVQFELREEEKESTLATRSRTDLCQMNSGASVAKVTAIQANNSCGTFEMDS